MIITWRSPSRRADLRHGAPSARWGFSAFGSGGGASSLAASFNAANSEYLSKSSSTVDTGGQSYALALWVYINALGTQEFFVAKYSGLSVGEFAIGKSATNRLVWRLVGNSNFYDHTPTSPTFNAGWNFLVCSYDNSTKVMSASLDNGTFFSRAAFSDSPRSNPSAVLTLGAQTTTTNFLTGRLDGVGIWVGRTLSQSDVSSLYNSGVGRKYAGLPAGLLTNLVSYYDLDEFSDGSGAVQRNDSHGSNHLTDNNTVPSADGIVTGGSSGPSIPVLMRYYRQLRSR